jgi:hypothetical protein
MGAAERLWPVLNHLMRGTPPSIAPTGGRIGHRFPGSTPTLLGRGRAWRRPGVAVPRLPGRLSLPPQLRLARAELDVAAHLGAWPWLAPRSLFTSAELRPAAYVYHHAWRDEDLSDHSELEADIVRGE